MAVCVRLAVPALTPMQVAFVRFAGSFVVLVLAARGRALLPRRASWPPLVLRALLGATAITCYYVGIERAGAGLATLLHATYPVWTALLAAAFLREPFTGRIAVALALNLVGAALAIRGEAVLRPEAFVGGLMALVGGVLAGGAVATASGLRRTESASVITVWFMAVGAAMTAPSLASGIPELAPDVMLALVGVVLTSAAGQWLMHHGLGFVSPTVGSLAAATSVVTATVLEALLLGDGVAGIHANVVLGAVLMLAAVALASRASPRAAVAETEPPD
ncbi:MAG: DMT family transporter [bacterium]|nr:DMT family transporter [bacterium]